jgi:hypothetical protein
MKDGISAALCLVWSRFLEMGRELVEVRTGSSFKKTSKLLFDIDEKQKYWHKKEEFRST